MKEKAVDVKYHITAGITLQKASKLPHGEIEVIVSNSGTDRHGESILLEGIDLSAIKKNPVVLWGHDYSSLPIGKLTKIWKSNGNLMARIKLATEIYDFADIVYKLVQDGTISAVSIGGIVKEWNDDYTVIKKMEMIELSVVPVGAHPDALVVARSAGITREELTEKYEKFLIKSTSFRNSIKEVTEPDIAKKTIIKFTYNKK